MNLKFFMPTQVLSGPGCIKSNAPLFKTLGTRALIVTGRSSAKKNGSLKDVTDALESVQIPYAVFDEVDSNPTIPSVRKGGDNARAFGADFIVGIGGGSPMDAAKAIAILASHPDIADDALFSLGFDPKKVLPLALVPTTSGTGSEVTQYSILTNDAAETKTSIASPSIFPKLAFLDAAYTQELGLVTTRNTALDALSHVVEGMLSNRAGLVSDALALEAIALIGKTMEALKKGILTPEDREVLLYASCLGGIVIAHTGTTVVHAMGYSLTYFHDIDHGRANGLLLTALLRTSCSYAKETVDAILKAFGASDIDAFGALLDPLMPGKEKLTVQQKDRYAAMAIKAKNVGNMPFPITEAQIRTMFEESV